MTPAVGTLCTVTVINVAGVELHATEFNVETVVLLNSVVAVNAPGA